MLCHYYISDLKFLKEYDIVCFYLNAQKNVHCWWVICKSLLEFYIPLCRQRPEQTGFPWETCLMLSDAETYDHLVLNVNILELFLTLVTTVSGLLPENVHWWLESKLEHVSICNGTT